MEARMRTVLNLKRLVSYTLRHSMIPMSSFTFSLGEGSRFRLHNEIESHSMWIRATQEEAGSRFARAYLRPGDTFVDIGANIGRYTVPASRIVGPNGRVIALEPTSSTCKALRENVELNAIRNTTVLQMAVSSINGTVDFWEYPGASTLNGMHVRANKSARKISVESRTGVGIADLAGGRIDLLKVDTEGLEPIILSSFGSRLSDIPCIIFECSKANYQRAGFTISEMLSFLHSQHRHQYEFTADGGLAEIRGDVYEIVNTELITVVDEANLTERVAGSFRIESVKPSAQAGAMCTG